MAELNMNDIAEGMDDVSMVENRRGGGGRGGGRGGKAKGRGGKDGGRDRRPQDRETQISRALSQLLRHKAEEEGINLDSEGFARVDEVLKWNRLKSLHATLEDLHLAATTNVKQRFSMKPAKPESPDLTSTNPRDWLIRANQGHSIAIDSSALLRPFTPEHPAFPENGLVVHGTFFAFWPAILESGGLKKMSRNHIHFATAIPETVPGASVHEGKDEEGDKKKVISGMRADAEVLIWVDVRKALEEGVNWWISENRVVLTEGDGEGVLSCRCWTKVEGRRQGVGVLWEEGKVVAELPEGLKARMPPRGKEAVGKRGGGGKGKGGRAKGERALEVEPGEP